MTGPQIELLVERVTRRFRRGHEEVVAIDDVTLRLDSGQLTALVGPSGSGKTTLLNLIMGEDEPDSGRIVGRPSKASWSDMAIVPQQLGLLAELTVRENIELPIRLGARRARPTDEVTALLDIDELVRRFPEETSLGQQQRVAIARALVVSPAIAIIDEPTSHQDEANVAIVSAALVETARRGALVLVATHDDRLVERCDQVVHLANGRLTER